jgi:hypothetical protein
MAQYVFSMVDLEELRTSKVMETIGFHLEVDRMTAFRTLLLKVSWLWNSIEKFLLTRMIHHHLAVVLSFFGLFSPFPKGQRTISPFKVIFWASSNLSIHNFFGSRQFIHNFFSSFGLPNLFKQSCHPCSLPTQVRAVDLLFSGSGMQEIDYCEK